MYFNEMLGEKVGKLFPSFFPAIEGEEKIFWDFLTFKEGSGSPCKLDLPEAIKVIEDMKKDEQRKKDITEIEHGMFIEGRNTPKNLSNILQYFSCLLFWCGDWKKFNYHNGFLGLDWQCYLSA